MKNQTLLIAFKWAGIQFLVGLVLGSLMTKLYTGGGQTAMMLGLLAGLLSYVSMVVTLVMAIRELETQNGKMMNSEKVFALSGWMLLLLSVLSILTSFVTFKFFLPEASAVELSPSMVLVAAGSNVLMLFIFYLIVLTVFGIWRVFTKAGQPGWASIVPIYNAVVQCEIGQKPGWWVLMLFIPFANIVFAVMIANGISKAFGKDEGFTAGLIFLPFIFYPLLGFGPEKWIYGTQQPEVDDSRIEDHLVD